MTSIKRVLVLRHLLNSILAISILVVIIILIIIIMTCRRAIQTSICIIMHQFRLVVVHLFAIDFFPLLFQSMFDLRNQFTHSVNLPPVASSKPKSPRKAEADHSDDDDDSDEARRRRHDNDDSDEARRRRHRGTTASSPKRKSTKSPRSIMRGKKDCLTMCLFTLSIVLMISSRLDETSMCQLLCRRRRPSCCNQVDQHCNHCQLYGIAMLLLLLLLLLMMMMIVFHWFLEWRAQASACFDANVAVFVNQCNDGTT